MRKATRYLIRKSLQDKSIVVRQGKALKDIEVFSQLHKDTAKLRHFVPFTLEYLKNEFLSFEPDNEIALLVGEYGGKIAAMTFVIFWSNIGFYHHAVLLPEYRKTPIAYRLQWEAIKEAKQRACILYDFWGYAEPKSSHPWAGPTLFKMGFGGYKKEYVKTKDFPLSQKYWFNFIIEKIRKKRRGF